MIICVELSGRFCAGALDESYFGWDNQKCRAATIIWSGPEVDVASPKACAPAMTNSKASSKALPADRLVVTAFSSLLSGRINQHFFDLFVVFSSIRIP